MHGRPALPGRLGDGSRPWKLPAIRSTRPLACGDWANICRTPSSSMALLKWVAFTGGWMCRGLPEKLNEP